MEIGLWVGWLSIVAITLMLILAAVDHFDDEGEE